MTPHAEHNENKERFFWVNRPNLEAAAAAGVAVVVVTVVAAAAVAVVEVVVVVSLPIRRKLHLL
jgi:hypothetical protein